MQISISASGLRDEAIQSVMTQAKNARKDKEDVEAATIVNFRDLLVKEIREKAPTPEHTVSVSASMYSSISAKAPEAATEQSGS